MCYSLFHGKDKSADGRKDIASTVTERSAPVAATAEPTPMPTPSEKDRQKAREEEIYEDGMPA